MGVLLLSGNGFSGTDVPVISYVAVSVMQISCVILVWILVHAMLIPRFRGRVRFFWCWGFWFQCYWHPEFSELLRGFWYKWCWFHGFCDFVRNFCIGSADFRLLAISLQVLLIRSRKCSYRDFRHFRGNFNLGDAKSQRYLRMKIVTSTLEDSLQPVSWFKVVQVRKV